MRFELRLQNGTKLFPIGMGWHQIIGEVGTATIREYPDFCRHLGLADYFAPHAKASWYFWRLGDAAMTQLLDPKSLCAPVAVTDATPGAGFISIEHLAEQRREVRVDVCLSVTPAGKDETSIFDEWNRIVAEAKPDLNREVFLRLTLAAASFRDFDMDGFRAGKRLGTTDIELEIRPSAI